MRKYISILFCSGVFMVNLLAQEQVPKQEEELTPIEQLEQRVQQLEDNLKGLKKLKITGYIQGQYQYGEKDASLKVGSPNASDVAFSRMGIRRGRIKIAYEQGIAAGVFQIDITERGVGVKDAYFSIKDPCIGFVSLQGGIFNRPFGNEISYSSSRRESPERSTIVQTMFPEERDLGAMIILQAPKNSVWHLLKLEAGIFAGNGIKLETDKRKDFIGHLSATKDIKNIAKWGLGISYYYGGVWQGTQNVFKMNNEHRFFLDSNLSNEGKFAKREYIGVDGQFSVMSILGTTQIRAEYLFGTQPAGRANSKSPNSSAPTAADTYIRQFQGGYVIFVQDIWQLPLSAVFKYDWYDPNIKVAKNDIGNNQTGVADVAQSTYGVGLLWKINASMRLQAFYEFNQNETSENLANYEKNRKDDVFTLRLQYKF